MKKFVFGYIWWLAAMPGFAQEPKKHEATSVFDFRGTAAELSLIHI
jgi:hypothetical protein